MRFEGSLRRVGKWWLVDVPIFEAATQGRTRQEAFEMIADWFAMMVDRDGFEVEIHPGTNHRFHISSTDVSAMVSLLLRRQRQA